MSDHLFHSLTPTLILNFPNYYSKYNNEYRDTDIKYRLNIHLNTECKSFNYNALSGGKIITLLTLYFYQLQSHWDFHLRTHTGKLFIAPISSTSTCLLSSRTFHYCKKKHKFNRKKVPILYTSKVLFLASLSPLELRSSYFLFHRR